MHHTEAMPSASLLTCFWTDWHCKGVAYCPSASRRPLALFSHSITVAKSSRGRPAALGKGAQQEVYSKSRLRYTAAPLVAAGQVDVNPVTPVDTSGRHKTIQKDARYLNASDVDNQKLDLIFFDCHLEDVQMDM
jgi:hypothetical protein